MDKLCAFLKKHNGTIGTVAFALLAVYGLIMATPAAVCLQPYSTMADQGAAVNAFYEQFMFMNNAFLILAIVGIVWSLLYRTLRNHIRKVYYISNFVWHIAYVVICLAVGVYVLIGVAQYNAAYAALPFDEMNSILEESGNSNRIDPNTPIFAVGYVVGALIIIAGVFGGLVCYKQFAARFFAPKLKPAEEEK